jgi:hypothetical protein
MNISLYGTVLGNNAMKFGAVSLTTVTDALLLSFASASFYLINFNLGTVIEPMLYLAPNSPHAMFREPRKQ